MPSVRVLVQFLTIPIFFNLAVDTRASAHGGEDTRDDIPSADAEAVTLSVRERPRYAARLPPPQR